ncbi:MAG: hypothetical protein KDA58_12765 [Planctomycetaceae bacterium]|nr:hypothetical protein [Planctomycetaceae bacterium]
MSKWFSSAANVFRRDDSSEPQPFQLECDCGQSHVGLRRARSQQIVCKSCGTALFVLPGDVYPPPRESRRKLPEAVVTSPDDPIEDGEPSIDDADASVAKTRPTTESPTKSRRIERRNIDKLPPDMVAVEIDQISVGSTITRKKPGPAPAPTPPPPPPREPLGQQLKRIFTPFRLIVIGCALLLMLTAMWGWKQHAARRALETVQSAIEDGRVAVEEGNWIRARDSFGEAVDAFELLGRTDAEAQEIRQLHREAEVLTRLTGGSVFEVIEAAEEAYRSSNEEDEKRKLDRLESHLRDKFSVDWFVIEGPVRRRQIDPAREKSRPFAYEIEFPWEPESGKKVRVVVDFPCLESLVPEKKSKALLLAGKFSQCSLVDDTWELRLEPETGFLWVNPVTYRALGFANDPLREQEVVDTFLKTQAAAMGMKP